MNARSKNGMALVVVLTLAALTIIGAGTAMAQRHGRGCGNGEGGPGHRFEMMVEHLELSTEQAEAIKGIREVGQAKNLAAQKDLMRLRAELDAEMLKDEPSEKTALDLVDKMGDLQTEMKANRLKNQMEVRKQLTPEQRDKMLVMKNRAKGPHGGGRGHGGGREGCEGSCGGKGHKGNRR